MAVTLENLLVIDDKPSCSSLHKITSPTSSTKVAVTDPKSSALVVGLSKGDLARMELNQCLQKLVSHFSNLMKDDDNGSDLLNEEFWALRDAGNDAVADSTNYPRIAGGITKNRAKNRYRDILPFDFSRVKLKELPDTPNSDYINANFVKGISGKREYVASQAPTPQTISDFWRMIWELEVKVILMACNEYEGTSKKMKCARYWPTEEEKTVQHGDISISLKSLDERDNGDFLIRRLQVDCNGSSRTVMHYHYTAWPDHGIPHSMVPILDMLKSARSYQPLDEPPIIIHCSAGCGRTGTLIAIDYVWNLLKAGQITEHINVLDILIEMRKQRQALVQTREQYEVVYRAIIELFERQIHTDDEHTYGNLDYKALKARSQQSIKRSAAVAEDILSSLSSTASTPTEDADNKGEAGKHFTIIQQDDHKSQIILNNDSPGTRKRREGRPERRHTYENTTLRTSADESPTTNRSSPVKTVSATIKLGGESPVNQGAAGLNPGAKQEVTSSNQNSTQSLSSKVQNPSLSEPVKTKPPPPPSKPSIKPVINTTSASDKHPVQNKPLIPTKNGAGAIKKPKSLEMNLPTTTDTKPKAPMKPPIGNKPPTPLKPPSFQYDLAGEIPTANNKPIDANRRAQSVKVKSNKFTLADKQISVDVQALQQGPNKTLSHESKLNKPKPMSYENAEPAILSKSASGKLSKSKEVDNSNVYHLANTPVDLEDDTSAAAASNIEGEYAYADSRISALANPQCQNGASPGQGYDLAEDFSDEDGEGGVPPPPVPQKTEYSFQEAVSLSKPISFDEEHYDPVRFVQADSKSKNHDAGTANGTLTTRSKEPTTPTLKKITAATTAAATIFNTLKTGGKIFRRNSSNNQIPALTKTIRRPSTTSTTSLQEEVMYRGQNMSYPNKPRPLTGGKSMPLAFKR